ncbi:MAG: anion permease [Betaproteobacteria bacterium]|nr:anion permease [Betaproteobacteria bacterium]
MPTPSRALFAVAVAVSGALLLVPGIAGLNPQQARTAAVVVLAIGLWSTAVIPAFLGSLVFLFAAMVLAVAPASVVFSGFHSAAMWLVFGGLVLGLGVQRVGLDVRLVRNLLEHLPRGYLALIYSIFAVGLVLAFVIPSASGRVAILVPIMLALAGRLGFAEGSRGSTGLVLAATMGTTVPAFSILPASVPNMALYGAAESAYGIQLTYGEYFALNFSVLGVSALVVQPLLIGLLFRDTPRPLEARDANLPWSWAERRLLAILLVALVLWVTDTLHGVSPAWVALGAALLCVAPRIGLLPPAAVARDIDYAPLLFLAGIVGLGAIATHNGLGTLIADRLLAVTALAHGSDAANFATIAGIGVVVGIVTTMPAQPSIMVPLAQGMADATGWSLGAVLMAPVATWSIFPFPYQVPPLVIAIALANLRILEVLRLLIAYFVFGLLVTLPLHFFWGRWLGYFTAVR